MAFGNGIIISPDPKGVFLEGIISGTPKPGTCMQVKASTVKAQGGRFTYEVFNQAADGTRATVIVLLPKLLFGQTANDAYVDGEHGYLYCPAEGEELNMLFQNQSGTADDVDVGTRFMIDDGTGLLIADSSGGSVPFVALEAVVDPVADQLIACQYTGH